MQSTIRSLGRGPSLQIQVHERAGLLWAQSGVCEKPVGIYNTNQSPTSAKTASGELTGCWQHSRGSG